MKDVLLIVAINIVLIFISGSIYYINKSTENLLKDSK